MPVHQENEYHIDVAMPNLKKLLVMHYKLNVMNE